MRACRVAVAGIAIVLASSVCRLPNHAPAVTGMPAGPAVVVEDTTYTYTVSARDIDGDGVCLRVDWGDGDTSGWSDPVAANSMVQFTYAWDSAGSCDVRAQARDAHGELSAWSDRAIVAVRDSHPVVWFRYNTYSFRSPLVLRDGTDEVFYLAEDGYALRAVDSGGDLRYSAFSVDTLDGSAFSSSPAYCAATGHVIVGNDDGELYAFTRTLELAWHWPGNSSRYTFDHRDWGTPVVRGNRIYAVRDDGQGWFRYIYCFIDLGEQVALVELDSLPDPWEDVEQPPALDVEGNVLLVSTGSYLYKFAPDLGSLLWRTFVGDVGPLTSPVIGRDGTIYCSASEDNGLYAVRPDGSGAWNASLESPGWPALGESLIFVSAEDGSINALRLADGAEEWSRSLGVRGSTSPVLVSNGLVCFYDWAVNNLYGVRQSDGAVLWVTNVEPDSWPTPRRDLDESYPAPGLAANGDILVPTDWGLARVRGYPGTTLASAAWPKWQHDAYNTGWSGGP